MDIRREVNMKSIFPLSGEHPPDEEYIEAKKYRKRLMDEHTLRIIIGV